MSAFASNKLRLSLLISLALCAPSHGADFTIVDGQTVTTQQTLNNSEIGTIEAGGTLSTTITAVVASGDNVTVDNSGNISTTVNNNAIGIDSTGANAIINNSGTITTASPVNGVGIASSGVNATISNSGMISTTVNGWGIASFGSNAIISNSGTISTVGSAGIFSAGSNASITNSGTISVTGTNSDGILSVEDNVSISNSGMISTTGDDSDGIYSLGDNATINNSGLISVTGTNSLAISGNLTVDSDTTLNILPGSQINGRIDLGRDGTDNDTANVYGGVSGSFTFENTENINLFTPGVVMGDTASSQAITVDPTGEATRGVVLTRMTSSIHNVISQRMSQTTPLKPVQLASLELSPGMYFEEHKPVAWAQVFGGTFDRDAEGGALGYDHNHVGANFGYEWDMSGHRVGLMGGVVHTSTDTQTASFETEADNYYFGAYANRKAHGLNITGSLIAGYGDHENERLVVDNLNGIENAKSDFDSWFISPGLTVASAYSVAERLELRPSASVNYSIAWLDDYNESGTTNSNLSYDDRKAKALTARLQLAAAYQFNQASEFEFRVGVNSRHTDDDDTKASMAGSQFKFANAGDENVTGGFAGATLRVADNNNLSLIADMEFGGDSDENYAAGSISLQYVF
jgi:hypothetical protein